jgi:hypothetical protein
MTIEFKIQLNDSGGAAIVQPQPNATILGPSLGSPQNQLGGSVPGDPPGGSARQSSGSGAVVVVVPIVISGCCCQKAPASAVHSHAEQPEVNQPNPVKSPAK